MKLTPQSLRWRLQLWHGLLLAAVLCAFGATALHLEKAEHLRNLDGELQRRLSSLVNALRAAPNRPPPGANPPGRPNLNFSGELESLFGTDTGFYYVVWMRGRNPIARSQNAPEWLPRPVTGEEVIRMRDGAFRETFLFAAPADCVLVGRAMEGWNATLAQQSWLLAAAGAALLVTGLLVGAWLVARALRPLEHISGTAAKIAAGDLSQRIPITTTDSELGGLVTTLNTTFARLDAAFAQQARFIADAAHELRTPVTLMLSETQATLARERSAADYRESLEACQRAIQRMRRLMEQLLDLARIEAGGDALQRKPSDLAAITSVCLDQISTLARSQGATIDADLSPAPLHGDPDRLAQVVTNLLVNAIQHTPAGGTVRVATESGRDEVKLTVTDTGPGIRPEDLPYVFDRFYRADKARTSASDNSGLGLSIAKAIVTAHGGSIEARSTPGLGASFWVVIPRQP